MQNKIRFLVPKYWPIWVSLGLLRLIVLLPQSIRMRIGSVLGSALYFFGKKRRYVVRRNLETCFPSHSPAWIQETTRKHFSALGKGIIEMGMAWWTPNEALAKLIKISGISNLENALKHEKGVIVLSAHFTSLELGVRLLCVAINGMVTPVYQRNENPFFDYIIKRNRLRNTDHVVDRDNVRDMVRVLRRNGILWYAPDQTHVGKLSALVPFFGVPAQSNTATSRLAQLSGAKVIPYLTRRAENDRHYIVTLLPPLEPFPTDDEARDTAQYHRIIEQEIMLAPEQYFWVHKRFKYRPPEFPDIYA